MRLIGTATTLPGTGASPAPTFNLWTEPWIQLLGTDAVPLRLGMRDCLVHAHELDALADPSPLVIASLQRLLAAIAQDIFRPESPAALAALIRGGSFAEDTVDAFGAQYGGRFDLFSESQPFMQTSDIGLTPPKRKTEAKTVAYLFPEEPSATNINHFFHRYDDENQYSPATAATGLITLSAFATSGGAGIKPSINGVPPLYVLPVGKTLFETIALSIITPEFQPRIASHDDHPAWRRDTVIKRSEEVNRVGYLESLTFPARRVRLFPERTAGNCSRSGEFSDVLVRKMIFEMGRSRPKAAELWFDPFAAYRVGAKGVPNPVRPLEGKVLWREYGTLFHTPTPNLSELTVGTVIAPTVVNQLANLQDYDVAHDAQWRMRCIGLRTDMKAKVFEWVDDTLDVPTGLLADPLGQDEVRLAIERAEAWNRRISAIHDRAFGRGRHEFDTLRQRMRTSYWIRLAEPFRQFILVPAESEERDEAQRKWCSQLFQVGEQVLTEAADAAGERGEALRQRAEVLSTYRTARASQAKEWLA